MSNYATSSSSYRGPLTKLRGQILIQHFVDVVAFSLNKTLFVCSLSHYFRVIFPL